MLAAMGSELPPGESTQYRAAAARLNYFALDRIDIKFTRKEVAKYMAKPSQGNWLLLKLLARYLIGVPRLMHTFEWDTQDDQLWFYTDSDWAGDKTTRKSTSGGFAIAGLHG